MHINATQANLFHRIVSDSQSGISVFDAVRDEQGTVVDFRFAYINPAGATILGRPAEDLIGLSYLAYFSAAESGGFFQLYRQVLLSGQPARLPEVSYFADGVQGWFDLNIVRHDDSVIATFVDITALKQTQIEEARQSVFFDQLLQTSPNGVIAYKSVRTNEPDGQSTIIDFRPVFFNASYERIVDEACTSVQHRSFRERFSQSSDEDLFAFYVQVVETGQSFQRERYYPNLTKWLLVSGAKLFDGFLLILSDITRQQETALAQQQLTQALQMANQELLRSNENLQQFAYVASHDLQEPLRKIQSFSRLLEDQYGERIGADGTDLLHRLTSAGARMSTLIRDLLTYSRLSTTKITLDHIALNDVLAQVLDDLSLAVRESGAQLTIAELPVVQGDSTQLGQLFQNLLSNALKFRRSAVHPSISVRAEHVPAANVPTASRDIAHYTCISVTDNGIGFDEKYTDRIFQVFQRLHGKQEFAGTGVGLAICQKVVGNHGGVLTANSQPGQGATFRVYLPVR